MSVRHLYIHVPFCHRVCPYCSFYKHQHGSTDLGEFVTAVLVEAARSRDLFPLELETVFLGGGTPTALSEGHLHRLLSGIREVYDWNQVKEFCLEANPRTITASKAKMMREIGVSRVSLGVQAWDEPTLHTLGRDHAPAEAEKTYHTLREAGFPSVSLDLMFSIPGQSLKVWVQSLQKTLSLAPDHISAYNLNYEEDTEFFERLSRGQYREDTEEDGACFEVTMDMLESAGYEHYEISNYAKPGHRSTHNESYWLGADYLGLGPSAFSTIQGKRWQNLPDTARYMSHVKQGVSAITAQEDITEEKRWVERFGLELRTSRGIPLSLIDPAQTQMLDSLTRDGLLRVEAGQIILTRQGKALVDPIAVALMG
jgi:oxygen-independent coproporphyrinogen III oxidase